MALLIDLNYYRHYNTSLKEVIAAHYHSLGYVPCLNEHMDVQVIKHLDDEENKDIDGVNYLSFKKGNSFFSIPFTTHRYIRSQKPDIVVIQGMIFPIQTILLRMAIGNKCKILIQHRAGGVYKNFKKYFLKLADKVIDGYLFTDNENAKEWIEQGVIANINKCHELLGLSTPFTRHNKEVSRAITGMAGNKNFLWVGRLDTNKDPLTALTAFGRHLLEHPDSRLYLIYQQTDLLMAVKNAIQDNALLQKNVFLVGEVPRKDTLYWYSAADYYLSTSHSESTGAALLESMACGCIPVLTDIPSYRKITNEGTLGLLFEPGNTDALEGALNNAVTVEYDDASKKIMQYFEATLSFKAIAGELNQICRTLPR